MLAPRLGAKGSFTSAKPRAALSAQVNAGLGLAFGNADLAFDGFYGGLGDANYETYGASAKFIARF